MQIAIQKNKGISLLEMLIATFVFSFLALGFAKLAFHIHFVQEQALSLNEANEFATSLRQYFIDFCNTELKDKSFPSGQEDITLTGFAKWSGLDIGEEVGEGLEIRNKWKIKKLSWEPKEESVVKSYQIEKEDYELKTAKFSILLEVLLPTSETEDKKLSVEDYSVDVPLLVDNSGQIKNCLSNVFGDTQVKPQKDICEVLRMGYDESTDSCVSKSESHCVVVSQFVNCTANRGHKPKFSPPSPCNELVRPIFHRNSGEGKYFAFASADNGEKLKTCPPNVKLLISGDVTRIGEQPCGKKCTNTYIAYGKIYSCVRCADSNPGEIPQYFTCPAPKKSAIDWNTMNLKCN